MVFGGSWGSTLALEYAMRFPEVRLKLKQQKNELSSDILNTRLNIAGARWP